MIAGTITIDASKFKKFIADEPKKMAKILQNVIYKASLLVEREAKIGAPVDTGRLRASIATDIHPMKATIEPHVEYARYVHDGTRYMKARPFMKNAEQKVSGMIEDIVLQELKSLS
jgi:HK97 gp10 family phage protein